VREAGDVAIEVRERLGVDVGVVEALAYQRQVGCGEGPCNGYPVGVGRTDRVRATRPIRP
jgi:hypothetical protein